MSMLESILGDGREAMMEAMGSPAAVQYRPPGAIPPFPLRAIVGQQRAASEYVDGDYVKMLRLPVQVSAAELAEHGVREIQIQAKVDAAGLEGWAIDAAETTWGPSMVTLGLKRSVISRHEQMEAQRE